MSRPFNLSYVRGATNEQLKNSLSYKPYLKTDDEIDGYKTNDLFSPVLINIVSNVPTIADGGNELHVSHIQQWTKFWFKY
jgi:hypothetical protein